MLAQMLTAIIDDIQGETVTLKELMEKAGREGMLIICALATLPFLIPISIPGVSTVFGAAIVLIACALLLDRLPWLPRRIHEKELDAHKLIPALRKGVKLVSRIDKVLKPRVLPLTASALLRINSMAIVFGGVLLMAPFGLIPFSNTAPAVAILLLTVGMIQRDGLFVLLGYAALVATLIYFSFLIYMAWLGGTALLG